MTATSGSGRTCGKCGWFRVLSDMPSCASFTRSAAAKQAKLVEAVREMVDARRDFRLIKSGEIQIIDINDIDAAEARIEQAIALVESALKEIEP